jgi:hypothetical protein
VSIVAHETGDGLLVGDVSAPHVSDQGIADRPPSPVAKLIAHENRIPPGCTGNRVEIGSVPGIDIPEHVDETTARDRMLQAHADQVLAILFRDERLFHRRCSSQRGIEVRAVQGGSHDAPEGKDVGALDYDRHGWVILLHFQAFIHFQGEKSF